MAASPQGDSNTTFDLIVIGAGVNGAGVARLAALSGLRTLVLERGDVCSGTSAWCSRLIHGGLRYLEYFEIGLVRESLAERTALLQLAPHLVHPLPLYLPIYESGRRPLWQIRLGLWLYDRLARWRGASSQLPPHRILDPSEVARQIPGLDSQGIAGAAHYYDGQVPYAERLVLANLKDAVARGAELRLYSPVERVLRKGDRAIGVRWRDEEGNRHEAFSETIVNAAGPWLDDIVDDFSQRRLIGGTKGSHIIVNRFEGFGRAAIYSEARSDGRPFFIIPWNDDVLIGTTDIRISGSPDSVAISSEEADYLIRETNNLFPEARLSRDDVRFAYSGTRPLPHKPRGSTGAITRRHLIKTHPRAQGVFSVVGGKLTTYRATAADVVQRVQAFMGLPQHPVSEPPLPGAGRESDRADFILRWRDRFSVPQLNGLWYRHGTESEQVLELSQSDARLARDLTERGDLLAAEVVYSLDREWAQHLSDILFRRTLTAYDSNHRETAAVSVAEFLVAMGRWSRGRAAEELENYRREVRERWGGLAP